MKRRTLILTAATLGLGALAASATLAHGPGYGQGYGPGYGPGYGMGYGMGPGAGQGMGPGMGQGRMQGHGYGAEDCPVNQALAKPLSVDDVRASLESRLQRQGNERLKVGKVEDKDDKTIVAEIVTVDNSLVERIEIDKATGRQLRAK